MRTALTLLLLLPLHAIAQTVPLEVKGSGVKTVQVDRTVVVKTDVLVASSFPFEVRAPAGSGLYFWTVPPGVQYEDRNEVLVVLAAPTGEMTVRVKMLGVDLDSEGKFKGYKTGFGSTTFMVGDAAPPPPVDAYVQQLQAAYAQERDPAALKTLIAFYRGAAKDFEDKALVAWGPAFKRLQSVATDVGLKGKLPKTQAVVTAELVKAGMPQGNVAVTAPITDSQRGAAIREFNRAAVALEGVK